MTGLPRGDLRPYPDRLTTAHDGPMACVMTTDLDESQCWALLSTTSLGRIALSVRALPMIVPVRFGVDGRRLRAHLPRGTDLDDAVAGAVVAFEADGYEQDVGQAWTVHAIGRVIGQDTTGYQIEPCLLVGTWLTFS
jgi:hypothetical protein